MKISKLIKEDILQKVVDYYYYTQLERARSKKINYAGRVYDSQELINLVNSSLEFNLTYGDYCKKFEKEFSKKFNIKFCHFVNSGSSANLLAFLSLTSHELGDRKINRGDEVITIAYAFPTTISPIILFGAVPVFVDIEFDNIDISQLELALSEKTKAVFVAHTLGNPF
ncbi:MAG TPA: DegT/DnrJ/EryC1/StrS family aminotransferase, partial [Bacteroidota bacterium]|nr:DegT/DnrJ/EryC1/StrS family aminotransferase [Bacteroidota bacterium]